MKNTVMKQKYLFLFFLLIVLALPAHAQNKIGDNPTVIQSGSLLELESQTKGLRLTRIQLDDIKLWTLDGAPVSGMIIFNESGTAPRGIYYWSLDLAQWIQVVNKSELLTSIANYLAQNLADSIKSVVNATTKNTLAGTSGKLTSTVNGVSADLIPANGAIAQSLGFDATGNLVTAGSTPTTNTLDNTTNILTSTINGVISTAPAVTSVANTLIGNNLTTSVNGITTTAVDLSPIVAANTTVSNTSTGNILSTIVNGIAGNSTNIINSNILTGTSGKLTSTVNGVSADLTPANGTIANGLGFDASGNLVVSSNGSGQTTNILDNTTNTITSTVNGIAATTPAVNTVVNTSSVNSLSTIINGVAGASVALINSSTLSNPTVNTVRTTINNVPATTDAIIIGSTLVSNPTVNTVRTTINGVAATTDATIIGSNVLTAATGNGITSMVNGVASTLSPAAGTITNTLGFDTSGKLVMQDPTTTKTSVSNTSSANSLNTTVNGVTGADVPLINSSTLSNPTVNTVRTTINGVAATTDATIIGSNTLTATNGNLVSTVNGVVTTPVVPVLISANNGLTGSNGNVALGGTLTGPTTITTSAANTLAIAGLQTGTATDNVIVSNGGVLKTIAPTALSISGDVSGTLSTSSVDKLKGAALVYTSLADKDLLQYNNSSSHWVNVSPASLVGSALTPGTGISISGTIITNTGVTSISGGTTGLTPVAATPGDVILSGTLAIANGGTGITTAATPGALVYGVSNTALGYTAAGNSGQVLISGAASTPTWTDASNLTVKNIYTSDGSLSNNRIVTQADKTLSFTNSLATGSAFGITGSGSYTGSGLFNITANSATTGTLASISSSSLTGGTELSIIASNSSLNSTNGLLYVANTTASTNGIIGRIQSNSTAGSGLTVLANGKVGIGTAAPIATLHNAGSTLLGVTSVSNPSASYSPTSAITVDNYSGILLTNSVTSTMTLPTPSSSPTTAGRIFSVFNSLSSSSSVTVGGFTLAPGALATFQWNGTTWVAPLGLASAIPLSGLTAAVATNNILNGDFAQTWNWNSSTAKNPFTIASSSLTGGNLFSLTNTNASHTGNVLALTSNATAPTAGIAKFNFTADHTGTGMEIDDATTSGSALTINSTGASYSGTGLLQVNANSATDGTIATINANGLTTGTALNISSTSTSITGGQLLNVASSGTSGDNSASGSTTTAATISNTHTGTTSTNVGLTVNASGGTNNYALLVPSGNVGIGTSTPAATLHNTGSTLLGVTSVSLIDPTYLPTAQATVDAYSGMVINQTSNDVALTLPAPTSATAGRLFTVSNSKSSTNYVMVSSCTLPAGMSVTLVWDGSQWSAPLASPITVVNSSNLFSTGLSGTGSGVTTTINSTFLGSGAGSSATYASNSNFLGSAAGGNATSASYSNFLGMNAGLNASSATYSNFLGQDAGNGAVGAANANFLGQSAGYGATNANGSNFFGQGAGNGATGASYSNFMGNNAGNNATGASYSTLLGYNVAHETITPATHIGSNNIIIGTNITLPTGTSNGINIGGVIFGKNTYFTTSGNPSQAPTSSGQIGIGVNVPTARLHLAASSGSPGTAPLKLSLGTNLIGIEPGAIEYDGTHLYFSSTTNGGTRYQLDGQGLSLPLSSLTAATANNSILNGDFAQTWNWNSSTATNPFTIASSSLTTGNLFSLANSKVSHTGNVLALTSNATAPTGGIAKFNFTGNHSGNGMQINDITTSGAALAINGTGIYTGAGLLEVNANSTTTGTAAAISTNALTTGTALSISSTSTGVTGGQLLNVSTSGVLGDNITSTAVTISNTHSGNASTNVGLSLSASGGTNNYALLVPSGYVGIGTATPAAALDVKGQINLSQTSGTGSIGLVAPGTLSSYTLTLPTAQGSNGQILQNDGSGNLSWVAGLTNALTSGTIYVGNASDIATPVAMSGDATLANDGKLTLTPIIGGGTYGSVTNIPTFTVDTKGRLTAAANVAATGIAIGGDVTGTLGATVVSQLQGKTLTITSSPGTGNLLQYNGTKWVNWTPNYLTLSSLSASAPLSYNNSTGVFSIAQATSTTNGYLSSGDWGLFYNKVGSVTAGSTKVVIGGTATAPTIDINTANIIASNALTVDVNGGLTSTVNGVASTPAVSVLTTAENGLTNTNGKVTLGGSLTGATTITTTSANTLTIAGLQTAAATDNVIMSNAGVIKTIAPTALSVGGDITGTLGATTVNKLQTTALSISPTPASGDLLRYNGSSWVNATAASIGSITLATGTSGNDVNFNASPVSLGGTITLNIPDASSSNRGVVTIGTQTFAGAKTFSTAIAAPTAGNTINGLVISSGALSGITGYAQASGDFAMSGTGAFSSGTGNISLNGNTTLASGKTLNLTGSSSGTVGFIAPATVTSYALTLPSAQGGNGQILQNDGSGNLSWVAGLTNALASGKIYVGSGNVATQVAVSGDAGLANDGTLTLTPIIGGGSYGSVTNIPTFTVDTKGRVTAASNVAATGITITGDVTGTLGATTVNKLQTIPLVFTSLTPGDILKYDGATTSWKNVSVALPASTASAYMVYGNNTNASATPTYFTPVLASALFANQGVSTNYVLHGNASGNPSWSAISLTADVTGTLPVANGGTNATTAAAARTNLGVAASGVNSDITSLTGLTTNLSVAQGGTGAQTLTANGVLYGNGTSAIQALAPVASGYVLTSTGLSSAPAWTDQSSLSTPPINKLTTATGVNGIDNAAYTQTWSWNSLAAGNGLALTSTNTSTTGSLLYVSSASAGAASTGLASFNFSGAHTGNGVGITDATTTGTALGITGSGAYTGTGLFNITANSATTGTLAAISSSSLTTGTGLKITASNNSLNSTNGLLYVANTSTSTAGIVGRIQSNSTAGSGLTVLANGNVGIGNVAPAVALDVTGSGQFTGNLTVNGSINAPSDIRLKTHIETLTNVLEKIDNLRGVSYEFINQQKYASGPQIGVIAQELQKVFPELVKKGTNGYLAVNYSQLTGVLIQAIKEQQQEINTLKQTQARQQQQIETILKTLQEIKGK